MLWARFDVEFLRILSIIFDWNLNWEGVVGDRIWFLPTWIWGVRQIKYKFRLKWECIHHHSKRINLRSSHTSKDIVSWIKFFKDKNIKIQMKKIKKIKNKNSQQWTGENSKWCLKFSWWAEKLFDWFMKSWIQSDRFWV